MWLPTAPLGEGGGSALLLRAGGAGSSGTGPAGEGAGLGGCIPCECDQVVDRRARQNRPGRSPFDEIRHIDEHGYEHWWGRELMPKLGYAKWQAMEAAIRRARISCRNQGYDETEHFTYISKVSGDRGGTLQPEFPRSSAH